MLSSAQVDAWVRRWWSGEAGAMGTLAEAAFAPAEWAYRAAVATRNRAYDRNWLPVEQAPIPVISIGNLTVGGSGKTPFSAWLAGRLADWGRAPAIVLRGYGEDEVLLHREDNPGLPVFTGAARIDSVRAAAAEGCDVAVLDDGFQHRALRRDLDVVLVSADAWRSRRPLLPRGPWRESVDALRRAHVAVVVRKAVQDIRGTVSEIAASAPATVLVECSIEPSTLVSLHGGEHLALDYLAGRKVLAVASLADPRPFAAHLHAAGAAVELSAFPDHYSFSAADAYDLQARAAGRTLMMTRKEAVKLRPLLGSDMAAYVLHQRVRVLSGGDRMNAALRRALKGAQS